MRALSTNRLATSPAFPKIMLAYNELLKTQGKVNNKKFYEQVILPEIPGYKMQSWYQFLARFKTNLGIVAVEGMNTLNKAPDSSTIVLGQTMLSNDQATKKLISSLLNISAAAAEDLILHPEKLTSKERIELGLKGMKSQDSRIHAIGKIREDVREQAIFDRAFDNSAYE